MQWYLSVTHASYDLPATSTAILSIDDHATIGMQRLPCNHTAVLARQEDKAGCDLARLGRSTHRIGAELIYCILLHGRGDQRRPHGPGSNGIDADAERDLLVVEATGKGDDGSLGGGVVQEVRAADIGVYGGVVDDCVTRL